jgi:hypothetical protein
MRIILLIIISILFLSNISFSQIYFPDKCKGNWKGVMYIYQKGVLKDSVGILFSVTPEERNNWNWKTEYLSNKFPLIKNYTLKLEDTTSNRYVVDEGGGILLYDYLYDNKLYAVFETHDILLTSTYELKNDNELIFEVTSGKKLSGKTTDEVLNYSVESLQRVVLRKK